MGRIVKKRTEKQKLRRSRPNLLLKKSSGRLFKKILLFISKTNS